MQFAYWNTADEERVRIQIFVYQRGLVEKSGVFPRSMSLLVQDARCF